MQRHSMDTLKDLNINDFEIKFYKKDNGKLDLRISLDRIEKRYAESLVLNYFFTIMRKRKKDDIEIILMKIEDSLGGDKIEVSYFLQAIKNLFIDFINQKDIRSNILKEVQRFKSCQCSFVFIKHNNPFGIQVKNKEKNAKIILALYVLKDSNLIKRTNLIILQIKSVIFKSGLPMKGTYNIYTIPIKEDLISHLNISLFGKQKIKEGGGILYLFKRNKNKIGVEGVYEVANI